jgi:hypothetical protein
MFSLISVNIFEWAGQFAETKRKLHVKNLRAPTPLHI